MSAPPSPRSSVRPARSAGPGPGAVRDLALGAPVAPTVALAGSAWLGWPTSLTVAVLAIYAVVALLILRGAPDVLPGVGLGPANRVTLLRVGIGLPVAGFAVLPQVPDDATRWSITVLATVVLALDGVDGWVARRTGTATRFGARFDMETDAALLMALSLVAWRAGPAGAWILGIGLLRYLFVIGGVIEPRLRGDLPEDQLRRKTVCVVQGIALPLAVAPLELPIVQVGVAGVALALLVWSFSVDTAWLLRNGVGTG